MPISSLAVKTTSNIPALRTAPTEIFAPPTDGPLILVTHSNFFAVQQCPIIWHNIILRSYYYLPHVDRDNFDVTLRSPRASLADLRGAPGTRQGRAPRGSKFFHFHAVFSKKFAKLSQFESWHTPLGKILDPPLDYNTRARAHTHTHTHTQFVCWHDLLRNVPFPLTAVTNCLKLETWLLYSKYNSLPCLQPCQQLV